MTRRALKSLADTRGMPCFSTTCTSSAPGASRTNDSLPGPVVDVLGGPGDDTEAILSWATWTASGHSFGHSRADPAQLFLRNTQNS